MGKRLPLAPGVKVAISRGRSWEAVTWRGLVRSFTRTSAGERLTYSEIARRSGLHRETIRRIAEGQNRPLLETGLKLAAVLGLRPWDLVEYVHKIWKIRGSKHAK